MEQANYLSQNAHYLAGMPKKTIVKSRDELMTSYYALPHDDQESITEFLRMVRNGEARRLTILEDINHLSQEEKSNPIIKELLKQFDYFNFELEEEKRFLHIKKNEMEIKLFFEKKRADYKDIYSSLLKGMRNGVGDFLYKCSSISLYLSDLAEFFHNGDVKNSLEKSIAELDVLTRENVKSISKDIGDKYAVFIYNNSYNSFLKKFSE